MATDPVRMVLAWSGGKDAAWTLHTLRRSGIEVVALLTTLTRDDQRSAMQGVGLDVLQAQAEAAGLPLVQSWLERGADNTQYEAAVADALRQCTLRWADVSTIAFGDLHLQDIRDYRVAQFAPLDWRVATPLFGLDTRELAVEMIEGGLQASLCCVDTTRLPKSFSGSGFDLELLEELPPAVDPCGENGEFHTCVHAGPMFTAPLALQRGATTLREGRFAYTDFTLVQAEGAPRDLLAVPP